MNGDQDPDAFKRLIAALEPWLDQVVIVGGWAHQLYRLHPEAHELEYQPLGTLDADIAVPATLLAGAADIRGRLLAYGFTEEFLGDDHPPATHYCLGGEPTGFYAEFLTPLRGSEYDRNQKRKATREVAGVVSQQLRYIELLLHCPWWINLESDGSLAKIQIANPVSFLSQKVLIHGKREREDRAKDLLYMNDTLDVFGAGLSGMRELWRSAVARQLSARALGTVLRASERLFGTVSDDIRRAAEISAERKLSPEAIRATCRYGFTEVFVDP
jgi:Nucleotidyltransferase